MAATAPAWSKSASVSRTPLLLSAAATVLLTLCCLPFAGWQLSRAPSFLPAVLAVVGCLDVLSVALILGEYRDSGDPRMLFMSWAYVWSLVTMLAYACAFPYVVADHPPLALTPSMAPWFYIAWHGGFPLLLGLAWAPWPAGWSVPRPAVRRRSRGRWTVLLALLVAGSTVGLFAVFAHRLPVLIHGVNTSAMTHLTAPVAVPLTLVSLLAAWRGTRLRTGPERWAPVAVLVCLADLTLTYAAAHRYSVGWYAGRTLTVVAAGVVLLATITALRQAKSRALQDALVDGLTGLTNRTGAHRDLELLLRLARRQQSVLSVVSLDVDHFKQVNDRWGHAVGDQVLHALGEHLLASVRCSDIAARVGGEEFLVLLPDTDTQGAVEVAEDIRRGLAALVIPALGTPVTASLGVATLLSAEESQASLLARADQALYAAKHRGRNCTVAAEGEAVPPAPRLSPGSEDRAVART